MHVRLVSQWRRIFTFGREDNWIEFAIVKLSMNYDRLLASLDITLAVLGFQIALSIPVGEATSDKMVSLEEVAERVKNAGYTWDVKVPEVLARELERRARLGRRQRER